MLIPTRIVPSVRLANRTTVQVGREFRELLATGLRIRPAGLAKRDPRRLVRRYAPRYKLELFDTAYYLADVRQTEDIRFFVAYIVSGRGETRDAHPRILYKDISLIWRVASHFVRSEAENWIGKGDVVTVQEGDEEVLYSDEDTTDLPLEIQTALELASRKAERISKDQRALEFVLRRGPNNRIVAYRDFTDPRRRAQSDARNLVNGGRRIAYFTRKNDPSSLRFIDGYEPDFATGILDVTASRSKLYGGRLKRFRIVSRNRRVQYLFVSGPKHVWIIPPQATTTELTSYGVRTIDVNGDDDAFIPGYEYHFMDESESPPKMFSQIPEGYAGAPNPFDASRADASAWLERLPVVRAFRRKVLAARAGPNFRAGRRVART